MLLEHPNINEMEDGSANTVKLGNVGAARRAFGMWSGSRDRLTERLASSANP